MNRHIERFIPAVATSDGAGVKLLRSLGQTQGARLDPFLMLDQFSTDNADDYIAGFPMHPHRGFETVTYMLEGHMLHEDHLGNRGDLKSGGVQWMTAGRGIIHSEMPQQKAGLMRGFQLWINLPAKEKMKAAGYRDITAAEIPRLAVDGGSITVIAGRLSRDGNTIAGPINAEPGSMSTDPLYLDIALGAGAHFEQALPDAHHAFVYPFEGEVTVIGDDREQVLPGHHAGLLSAGARLQLRAGDQGARLLLLAGKPLNEPVVQYGPFVMNTREEVEQALADYRDGTLAL